MYTNIKSFIQQDRISVFLCLYFTAESSHSNQCCQLQGGIETIYDMAQLCTSKMPHNRDGPWSALVCFSAMMSWTAAVGFVFSFGIFFPVFMDYFNEDRERTGMNQ